MVATLVAPTPASFRLRRPFAVLTVIILLVLAGEGWLPRIVDQAHQQAPAPVPAVGAEAAADLATHAVMPVAGRPGTLEVRAPDYSAGFGPAGFTYAPTGADAPLALSLTAVERGRSPLALAPGVWAGQGSAASRPVHPGITERVTALAGEVEWDVVLDAPPAGTGDLRVRADLGGVVGSPVAEEGAWRLRLSDGTDVRLGEVVVVDADGTELHRSLPTIDGGEVVLTVPGGVLRGATYPVTVDPKVGPAKRVTGPGNRQEVDVAFDGTNHFVVWADQRGTTGWDVYGSRVRASDGTVLDPGGIPIAATSLEERNPAVAFNGSVFLVVWELTYGANDHDIQGHRVTTAGAKTGGLITLAGSSYDQNNPDVASDGTSFQAVWQDDTDTGRGRKDQIWGGRVAGDGSVVDGVGGRRVIQSDLSLYEPVVAWNAGATAYLVAYLVHTGPGLFDDDLDVARLVGGVAVNPVTHLGTVPAADASPAVASDGTNWLVVYASWDFSASRVDIKARRVAASGQLVDGRTLLLGSSDHDFLPDVAYNGVYFVTWQERESATGNIRARRVDSGGGVLDPTAIPVATSSDPETAPAVAPGKDGGVGLVHELGSLPSKYIQFNKVTPK